MQRLLACFSVCITLMIVSAYSIKGKDWKYYFDEGEKNYAAREYSKAITNYNKCIKFNPDYMGSYFKRGLCRVKLDSNKLAIEDFTIVVNIQPNGEVYYQRACAEFEIKDTINACFDFNSACDLQNNRSCDVYSKLCRNR